MTVVSPACTAPTHTHTHTHTHTQIHTHHLSHCFFVTPQDPCKYPVCYSPFPPNCSFHLYSLNSSKISSFIFRGRNSLHESCSRHQLQLARSSPWCGQAGGPRSTCRKGGFLDVLPQRHKTSSTLRCLIIRDAGSRSQRRDVAVGLTASVQRRSSARLRLT